MTVFHKDLTGTDLHEPKGIVSALSGTVYVADGAGSGTWVGPFNSKPYATSDFQTIALADIGTASTTYSAAYLTGTLISVNIIYQAAMTGVASNCQLRIGIFGGASTLVSFLSLGTTFTLPVGPSGPGYAITYAVDPAIGGNGAISTGQYISLTNDGAGTGPTPALVTYQFA